MIRQNHAPYRLALTLALTLAATAPALAQKGKPGNPPPPSPPGTIYFEYLHANNISISYYDILKMKADGTNKMVALPGPVQPNPPGNYKNPSDRTYSNGDRWWLGQEEPNVYAYRLTPDGVQTLQVTDFSPRYIVRQWKIGWSNDGDDSFLSFAGEDRALYNITGVLSDIRVGLYRINFTGDDLDEAGLLAADPLLGDASVEELVSQPYLGENGDYYDDHDWSPDGTRVAFTFRNPGATKGIYVTNLVTNQTQLLALVGNPYGNRIEWSPTADQILVWGSSVHILDATNGTLVRTVLQKDSKNQYSNASWSPDGAHIAVFHRSGTWLDRYQIARVPATGGTLIKLTSDLDAARVGGVVGWLPDVAAGP